MGPASAISAATPPIPIPPGVAPTAWRSWPAWSSWPRDAGWTPVNADCTVVAEQPRLAPFVDRMAERLAAMLGAPVNVKATRAEGLGALGRAEGIACMAVVLLAAARAGGSRAGRPVSPPKKAGGPGAGPRQPRPGPPAGRDGPRRSVEGGAPRGEPSPVGRPERSGGRSAPGAADRGVDRTGWRSGRRPSGRPGAAQRQPADGVRQLLMADGMDAAPILDEIEALAGARRVRIEYVSRRRIDAVAGPTPPRGWWRWPGPSRRRHSRRCASRPGGVGVPFLLVLDGITDPHNVGSLLRSAECAGVTGVVLPRHRSAHLSPTVAKVAAGAIEYLPMALVAGVPAALQKLTELGVWSVGLVGEATQSLYRLPLGDQPVALVLGSEGSGLGALTRRRCEVLASIPQHGRLSSLNVATAGAIACFDVARRRSG